MEVHIIFKPIVMCFIILCTGSFVSMQNSIGQAYDMTQPTIHIYSPNLM